MTMTDPIADFLTRIRNACSARHRRVDIPASNLKLKIAELLVDMNFLRSVDFIEDGKQGILRIRLKYTPDSESVISGIMRVSRPGLRIHMTKKDLFKAVAFGRCLFLARSISQKINKNRKTISDSCNLCPRKIIEDFVKTKKNT